MCANMNLLESNVTKSAPEIVRDKLREEIFTGVLVAGQQLRQDEIADRFGTSRIPVREALRQLESENLVSYFSHKGAVVKGFSINDVLQMLDIRIALECRALKLAIPNMAMEDFEAAQDILDNYSHSSDPSEWGEMNWKFHWTLYAPCNRIKLLSMIESNYGHVSRYVRTQISISSGKDQPQHDHHELLDLCREGKVEMAVQYLEAHIEKSQKSLSAIERRRQALSEM